jgi:hypothetical protein
MKLSEAIRLGAMLKPQGFGGNTTGPMATVTCALGAAYEAAEVAHCWIALSRRFPILMRIEWLVCPACDERVETPIPHLNDDHRWTREQIADWVATIEAQHEPTPEPHPVSVEVEA